jgi:glucosyl-3-phosphoglycerate synthase
MVVALSFTVERDTRRVLECGGGYVKGIRPQFSCGSVFAFIAGKFTVEGWRVGTAKRFKSAQTPEKTPHVLWSRTCLRAANIRGDVMSDFYQTGPVATMHRLGDFKLEKIEGELESYSRIRPVALVLPCLYAELERPALLHIVRELRHARYIRQIIVSLGAANEENFRHARRFFSALPQETIVIWNDGPGVLRLRETLEESRLPIGPDGKGRATWMAYGYVLASRKAEVIALHDCDITTYSRELVARLVYPVVNPNLGFEFCKGYYARYADRMFGRVTRLLMTPLVRTLKIIFRDHCLLDYLDSFRYPLAGEFSMSVDLARVNRIPSDWGLEIGMLAEVYRNTALKRICQSELCEVYDHKHQSLEPNPEKGLLKMCVDISKNLFRTLASEGVVISEGHLKTILSRYQRLAEDMIDRYHADALINGLAFDRHSEESAVEMFAEGIRLGGEFFLDNPLGISLIPNWNRVASALPDFLEELKTAVDSDNRSAPVVEKFELVGSVHGR